MNYQKTERAKMNEEKIFEGEYNAVYRYALSLCKNEQTAEDLTQNAFLKLLEGKSEYKGKSTVFTYLCAIVKNAFFDELKKQRKSAEMDESLCDGGKSPDEALSDKDMSDRIFRSLHGIREPYREIFYLRVFGELSFSDIAAMFGKTESWARVTYYRAKSMITDTLK